MSFFWSTSYTPTPKSTPPPPAQEAVVVEKNEPYVSPRSVPTADAFKAVEIISKKKAPLVVEITSTTTTTTKPVSVADACTPVQSPYDLPELESEFTFDDVENVDPYDSMYTTTEPCTPVSVTNKRSAEHYDFQERIHRLETLFNRGLYQHLKVVHQGVYKDSVLHGGHIASPDREDLDTRENVHLHLQNSDATDRLIELQHRYAELVAQSRQFAERLEQLTDQLSDLALDL
jgi:hypothetical protein